MSVLQQINEIIFQCRYAMNRIWTVATALLGSLMTACYEPGSDAIPVKISAIELHNAFIADARAAARRWDGKTLLITGEVAIATPAMRGWTMQGEVQVPAKVYFRTALDYLPHDIKYVVCDGDFNVPRSGSEVVLDPRIQVGKPVTVECRAARLRWTDPGLYLSNCSRVVDP